MDIKIPDNLDLEFQERADPKVISSLDKIGQGLVVIFNQIKSFKIDWPKIFKVQGVVDVDSVADLPPIHIKNFKDLKPYFDNVEKATKYLATAITLVSSKGSNDQKISIPAPIVNFDTKAILNALQEIKDVSSKPNDNSEVVNMLRNVSEGIGALVDLSLIHI